MRERRNDGPWEPVQNSTRPGCGTVVSFIQDFILCLITFLGIALLCFSRL